MTSWLPWSRRGEAVIASGAEWTILRPLFPAINSLAFGPQVRAGDVIRAPYLHGASSAIHEHDVAA
ncbi:hypothetical protein [Thermoactinospora rubra]|uniref:hypothetical protein n=1 Tax=Thermoactinospora rubra TaxID=1088767 RepID=UPI000A1105E8|nr:hypothetical protein [Thermoactinospora rubra]